MKRTKQRDTHTCDYCRAEGKKERATWKHAGDYACDNHKENLARYVDDDYMTEADYQTWGRL